MLLKRYISICLLLSAYWLLLSCDPKRLDTKVAKAAIEASQPKRVLPEQIVAQVDEWGKVITDSLNKDLSRFFTKSMMKKRIWEEYKADVRFLTLKDLQNKTLDEKTHQVLEAYQYNAEHHLPQTDNIQKIEKEDTIFYLYTLPVAINEKLLKIDSLKSLKKGDLLGVWGIKFTKKEVIKKLNIKHLLDLKVG